MQVCLKSEKIVTATKSLTMQRLKKKQLEGGFVGMELVSQQNLSNKPVKR